MAQIVVEVGRTGARVLGFDQREAGVAPDEKAARVHLAAMLLSPDTGPVGSLLPGLQAELAKLRADGGKWIT